MKKLVTMLLCAVVLIVSMAGVANANEEIGREQKPFTLMRFVKHFINAFEESEYAIIEEIKDLAEDNKEIKLENKELREQLKELLAEVREDGIKLDEETRAAFKDARGNSLEVKQEIKDMRDELISEYNLEDGRAVITAALEDEELFEEIANGILSAMEEINSHLSDRNDTYETLIDIVEEFLQNN